jgi:uncharacterized delta-60 repeat protein
VLVLGAKSAALGVTIGPADSSITIAGSINTGTITQPIDHVIVARFDANAALDSTFGGGGTSVGGTVVTDALAGQTGTSIGTALSTFTDGGLLVVGRTWAGGHDPKFTLLRYSSAGRLDPGFAAGGILVLDVNPNGAIPHESGGFATSMAVQPDGKLLAGGSAAVWHGPSLYWSDFALIRLDSRTGALDPGFGNRGVAIVNFGGSAFIQSVFVQPDGRIVVAGFAAPTGTYDVVLARFNPDGSLDGSFGRGGLSINDMGGDDRAYAMAALPGGGFVTAGQTATDAPKHNQTRFLVARFDANGNLDPRFGDGKGWVATTFPNGVSAARGVVLQGGGILAAGFALGATGDNDFAIVRYTAEGALDECAGDGGQRTLALGDHTDDAANAIALQPDDTPVLVGHAGDNIAVLRMPFERCRPVLQVQ